MNVDLTELEAYANHIEFAVDRAEPELAKIVERGASNIKRLSRARLSGLSRRHYLKHYYRSIDYDLIGKFEAEIGPNPDHLQGKMGRGVEFGSAHTPPFPHLLPSADEEEPRFVEQSLRALFRNMK